MEPFRRASLRYIRRPVAGTKSRGTHRPAVTEVLMNCGFVGIKRSARVRTNNRPCQTKTLDQKCSRNKMLQDETASCCETRHVVGSSLTKHELADVEDLAGSGQPTEARGILN